MGVIRYHCVNRNAQTRISVRITDIIVALEVFSFDLVMKDERLTASGFHIDFLAD